MCGLFPAAGVSAAGRVEADTVRRESVDVVPYVPALAGGALMAGTATLARYGDTHRFDVPASHRLSDRGTGVMQYAPLVLPWALKAAGVPTRSGWGRMAVSQGVSVAVMAASVEGLKRSISSTRPDGSDTRSFPSGHTAWAFMGATSVAYELGGVSAWYPLGAYTLATAIAVERVLDRHHYPTDVMAGAGVGLVSSGIGYLIGDLIFGDRQIDFRGSTLRPNDNFSFLSVSTGLNLPIGKIHGAGVTLDRLPALTASLRGGWGIDDKWGLGVELGLLSTPLVVKSRNELTYAKNLTSVGVVVTPYYTYVLNNRFSFTADAGAGYRKNFAVKLDGNPIEAGGGTAVGRVDVGCSVRFTGRFSAKVSAGYEVSGYKFRFRPSETYRIPAAATVSGVTSSLLLSISSRYEF